MDDTEVKFPMIKAITAWIAALLSSFLSPAWETFTSISWDKLAQFAAFVYSLCLIYEWAKKKHKKGESNGTE